MSERKKVKQGKVGMSRGERSAWQRHLQEHPEDAPPAQEPPGTKGQEYSLYHCRYGVSASEFCNWAAGRIAEQNVRDGIVVLSFDSRVANPTSFAKVRSVIEKEFAQERNLAILAVTVDIGLKGTHNLIPSIRTQDRAWQEPAHAAARKAVYAFYEAEQRVEHIHSHGQAPVNPPHWATLYG